ncbi:MAG: hypothetical protein K8T89_18450 [Planctomycetes bacterium]|nr:hypothetical protein [Planctomycetota bacterium]
MKRKNWALIVLSVVGITGFILSRTVWGPPSSAGAAEPVHAVSSAEPDIDEPSDAQRRYMSNQPRHWRHVVVKR